MSDALYNVPDIAFGGGVANNPFADLAEIFAGIESIGYTTTALRAWRIHRLLEKRQLNGQDSTTDATSTEKSDEQTTTGDKKLIKLGKEVHGPEDAMIINRDQVQFYENLKSDGEVAKLIDQYKQ
jgi:hypothetical protein